MLFYGGSMKIHELVIAMKQFECRLTPYEEKYGVLSEDFHCYFNSFFIFRDF